MSLSEILDKHPRYPHVWDIGFGNGQVTELLAVRNDVVIAVEIEPKFIRKFPANVIPMIANLSVLTRGIVDKTIPLVYIDIGNNAETFRYILQQFVNRAKTLIVKNYPWTSDILVHNEFGCALTPYNEYTEIKWMH